MYITQCTQIQNFERPFRECMVTFDHELLAGLGKEISTFFVVDPIYLQESLNSIYMCRN